MHTRCNKIIKPTDLSDIYPSHAHRSNPVRIEMFRGYSKVKERLIDSEESTRVILSHGIEQMESLVLHYSINWKLLENHPYTQKQI